MIECRSIDEFVRFNDDDVRRIIISNFKNVLHARHDLSLEDILQSFYLHITRSKAVEKFDKNYGVKFSTYMFRCIHNYMCAFQVKIKRRDRNFLAMDSLDEKLDGHFSPHELIPDEEVGLSLFDIEAVRNEIVRLEKKYPFPAKIKLSELYEHYCEGYTDVEIGKKFKISSAGVGARKRSLQKIVAPLLCREVI